MRERGGEKSRSKAAFFKLTREPEEQRGRVGTDGECTKYDKMGQPRTHQSQVKTPKMNQPMAEGSKQGRRTDASFHPPLLYY